MPYYVYILSNRKNGVLYTGITVDLLKRVYEHKERFVSSFTQKYHVQQLVYYEIHEDVNAAIWREKQIKRWRRSWKIRLIEETNPDWTDLYKNL